MNEFPPETRQRLASEPNVWLASVRPDGRPHLVPVWFVPHAGKLYVCIEPESVKARNIRDNPRVVLALEDGSSPVICEGTVTVVPEPWPAEVVAIFQEKYGWDVTADTQYTQLVEVTPAKWLTW